MLGRHFRKTAFLQMTFGILKGLKGTKHVMRFFKNYHLHNSSFYDPRMKAAIQGNRFVISRS